jgi:hypothetical protein
MFLYVMGTPLGHKKIGLAVNPARRRFSLQTASPTKIDILHTRQLPDPTIAVDIERRAHWLLREHRLSGEWFNVPLEAALSAIECAVETNGAGEKATTGAGRPRLSQHSKTILTGIRLTDATRERIIALVGPNRMAVFIREAIDNELERREAAKTEAQSQD